MWLSSFCFFVRNYAEDSSLMWTSNDGLDSKINLKFVKQNLVPGKKQ